MAIALALLPSLIVTSARLQPRQHLLGSQPKSARRRAAAVPAFSLPSKDRAGSALFSVCEGCLRWSGLAPASSAGASGSSSPAAPGYAAVLRAARVVRLALALFAVPPVIVRSIRLRRGLGEAHSENGTVSLSYCLDLARIPIWAQAPILRCNDILLLSLFGSRHFHITAAGKPSRKLSVAEIGAALRKSRI
ncbi:MULTISPECIES: hypothetical protein [unclassified Bosea (in: a-proteobacteria)]|uniref:hypothetical protein n=1 Tax=unclassified Bosea (in: a-proteobacteria) TaxID=2653178 RepID=UPI000F7E10D4|nr:MULTISPECIES: hypothetical protein [unclassified Bosea (in: a-proteobacteria)]